MPLLLFLGISFLVTFSLSLHTELIALSAPFQELCLSRLPSEAKYLEIYQALLCGQSLKNGAHRQLFIDLGWIHLLVISGAHLLWIEKGFGRIPIRDVRIKKPLSYVALALFALLSGSKPPVIRALVRMFVSDLDRRWRLNQLAWVQQLVTGLLILNFFPEWIHSPSFVLSLLAATLLSILPSHPQWKRDVFLYALLSIYFGGPSGLSPLPIFLNFLLLPIWSKFLFPVTALLMAVPKLFPLIDFIWKHMFATLYFLHDLFLLNPTPQFLSLPLAWAYLIILIGGRHLYHLYLLQVRPRS